MKLQKLFYALLVSVTLGGVVSEIFVNASETTYASEVDNQEESFSQEEKEKAIDNLANALESAYRAAPDVDEVRMAEGVMAYVAGDAQESDLPKNETEARIAALYGSSFFSLDRFGKCMLNKMGLGELKNLAKVIFKPATVRYLKSHAWKKASAMMVNAITKHASKKVASLAVKRIANIALPGIGWASVALWGAECGWDEFH